MQPIDTPRDNQTATPSTESSTSTPSTESFQPVNIDTALQPAHSRPESPYVTAARNISTTRTKALNHPIMPTPSVHAASPRRSVSPIDPQQMSGSAASTQGTYIRTFSQSPPTVHVLPETGPNSLPISGSKSVPPKFTGNFAKVKEFISHYEKLCALKHVRTDEDKIKCIGQYCSKRVRTFLEGLSSYHEGTWPEFKDDFLNYYDAERDEKRFKKKDLSAYVTSTRIKNPFTSLSGWKKYDRGFIRIAGWLHAKNKLTSEEVDFYFWKGIPRELRNRIEQRLLLDNPHFSYSKPFLSKNVRLAAEELLQRSRFDQELLPSDDDSDDNSDLSQ